jgi:phosphate transport system permease protein
LAAMMANTFPEAREPNLVSALMYSALVLMAITLMVNILGAWILQRASRGMKGGR